MGLKKGNHSVTLDLLIIIDDLPKLGFCDLLHEPLDAQPCVLPSTYLSTVRQHAQRSESNIILNLVPISPSLTSYHDFLRRYCRVPLGCPFRFAEQLIQADR